MKTIKDLLLLCLMVTVMNTTAQEHLSRIIVFGAHPDDCDLKAGGTAIKFARMGHAVKFVSLTNGDAGHQSMGGGALAKRRYAEALEAAKRMGIEYTIIDNHDGELLPTLENRLKVIREIRKWNADVVISPRPNDYHPDHRYAGILVQDAAYMIIVPNVVPDIPPLKKNPVFSTSRIISTILLRSSLISPWILMMLRSKKCTRYRTCISIFRMASMDKRR